MTCDSYNKLSYPEKVILTGELIHALQTSEKYFHLLTTILNEAVKEGVLENVKILPETRNENSEPTNY